MLVINHLSGHSGSGGRHCPATSEAPRLDELAESGAASDAVIDRLRTGLQARIGNTRARINFDPETEPGALTDRELWGDLIAAEYAELSRLFEAGTISAASRRQLQRNLDLEVTRLAEGQR